MKVAELHRRERKAFGGPAETVADESDPRPGGPESDRDEPAAGTETEKSGDTAPRS